MSAFLPTQFAISSGICIDETFHQAYFSVFAMVTSHGCRLHKYKPYAESLDVMHVNQKHNHRNSAWLTCIFAPPNNVLFCLLIMLSIEREQIYFLNVTWNVTSKALSYLFKSTIVIYFIYMK